MKVIDLNSVVVFSSAELKMVLEENNNYNYVYLGSDITLESGIKISSTKSNITINGTYDNIRHTFTDKKSLGSGDTISASYSTILKVTVCNMDVIGYNYYGVIYVPETSSNKNIVVEYNNIKYTGPQMSFHPVGLTRFIDCDITISDGDLTVGNEVAECNQIELGGTTNITHNSKSNSAFWFRNSNPSLIVLSNAIVNFKSEYRELFYGVNNLAFSILSNGYFSVTSHSGMAYSNFGTGNTNISSMGTFILKQTSSNGNYSTWYSYGSITLNENSSLFIINNYTNISSSNYNITFSSNSSFILNNPREVVLYNEKANIISASSSIPYAFNFSRINLFDSAIDIDKNISYETLPTYSWYKDNLSSISGKFTSTTNNIESHNFTNDELQILPQLSNFNFVNKKILSIGDFTLRINAVTDSDLSISGKTGTGNSVLISYNDSSAVVVSDENGNFKYDYDSALPIGTIITFNVKKYNDLIYHTKIIQIVYAGELVLSSASSILNFNLIPINNNPILCPRSSELVVKVIDSRVNGSDWKLYASISEKLKTISGEIFDGEIVYRDSSGNIYNLSSTPTLVYTGVSSVLDTTVSWNEDEGILLMINDKIISGLEYETKIVWSIEE